MDSMFITVISTAGARELPGLFRESPWKDKNRARVSCPLSVRRSQLECMFVAMYRASGYWLLQNLC